MMSLQANHTANRSQYGGAVRFNQINQPLISDGKVLHQVKALPPDSFECPISGGPEPQHSNPILYPLYDGLSLMDSHIMEKSQDTGSVHRHDWIVEDLPIHLESEVELQLPCAFGPCVCGDTSAKVCRNHCQETHMLATGYYGQASCFMLHALLGRVSALLGCLILR